MKLFNRTDVPKKFTSIEVTECCGIVYISLVDSVSGKLITSLMGIKDKGIMKSERVADCLRKHGYEFDEDAFDVNGSIKTLNEFI